MNKLNGILGGDKYSKVSWSSRQVNDAGLDRMNVKQMRQEIKALMLELVEESKTLDGNVGTRTLLQKIEEL